MSRARRALPLLVCLLATSCEREIVPEAYAPSSAHDAYRYALEEAGLHATALGREWSAAARSALRSPVDVVTPFRESFYVDPGQAFAAGYRFPVERGQRTEIVLSTEPAGDWRLFLDLFREPDDTESEAVHVASGGEGDARLAFEPRETGVYLLRIQSELLRGGGATIEIRNVASLEFPVEGRDTSAIGSGFGAPREGGRREHHGVDIFAPRHTVVRAPTRARVRRVAEWKLGGLVVWLEDHERNLRLYFAHLQSQDVREGAWVAPGDPIGTVGNSGNARTTPPHLHFGIYSRGEGPIDPRPFLQQPSHEPRPLEVDATLLGGWVRTNRPTSLAPSLHARSDVQEELVAGTALRVLAGAGSSYRVALPNGVAGYVQGRAVEPLAPPLRTLGLSTGTALRDRPAPNGGTVERVAGGVNLDVLATFEEYLLVRNGDERLSWLPASLESNAAEIAP